MTLTFTKEDLTKEGNEILEEKGISGIHINHFRVKSNQILFEANIIIFIYKNEYNIHKNRFGSDNMGPMSFRKVQKRGQILDYILYDDYEET